MLLSSDQPLRRFTNHSQGLPAYGKALAGEN